MPTYQGTFIMNQGKYGWSETWYMTTDSTSAAMTRMVSCSILRQKLMGNLGSIEAIRVSDVEIFNDSLLRTWNVNTNPDTEISDTPWNALLCRASAQNLHRRQVWLRGVPDAWFTGYAVSLPTNLNAVGKKLIDDFINQGVLGTPKFQLRVYSRIGQGNAGNPITGAPQVDGLYTKFSSNGFSGAVGEKAQMKKWKGPDAKALNKTYNVLKYEGVFVTLDLPWNNLDSPENNFGGRMYPKKIVYVDIDNMVFQRAAKRNTGRAFFVQRGRRAKRGTALFIPAG